MIIPTLENRSLARLLRPLGFDVRACVANKEPCPGVCLIQHVRPLVSGVVSFAVVGRDRRLHGGTALMRLGELS